MKRLRLLRFDILFAIYSLIGGIGLTLAYTNLPLWANILATAAFIAGIVIILVQRSLVAMERKKSTELTEKIEKAERTESIDLYSRATECSTAVIKLFSETIQKISKEFEERSNQEQLEQGTRKILKDSANDIIKTTLRNIRNLFEGDSRGIDTTTYPHNYFKCALFEVVVKSGEPWLIRTYYAYPSGVEPHDETTEVNINDFLIRGKVPIPGHVRAYKRSGQIDIIKDVKNEFETKGENSCWANLYTDQHKTYESIIDVAIVEGSRGTPGNKEERQVLAVLAIDTNRVGYFREDDQNYKAFLGEILSPFRTILTIALEIKIFANSAFPF